MSTTRKSEQVASRTKVVSSPSPAGVPVGGIPEQGHRLIGMPELTNFLRDLLTSHGLRVDRARLAAEALCYAEATGSGYGLTELYRWYVPQLRSGQIHADAEPLVIADRGATSLLDYRHTLGLWAVSDAMERAIMRARLHGVGLISLRGVREFGRAGQHARRAVPHGMIGLVLASVGDRDRGDQTSLGIASPAGSHPSFVFDLDADALSVSNPQLAAGLMLLVEVLTGLLSGITAHDPDKGLLVVAIAPATLRSESGFYRHASTLFGDLCGRDAEGVNKYPGWDAAQRFENCKKYGIAISETKYQALVDSSKEWEVSAPALAN